METGLIAAGLGGLNYVVGLQMKPLQVEMHELKNKLIELEQRNAKSFEKLEKLLTPLIVQVQVNKERYEDLNKKVSSK
ncbi:hypothetical protein HK103_004853 [Boothiomyces macroporosus]|uniref:Uncharacterized protein n=1 Tax=Boothiomyces macroporosus TaxID=261099 RepID=A0AAD5UGT8_9FUNG|nr:hypothetical protein HK103_004853 [Boothiomyces macroporosus]